MADSKETCKSILLLEHKDSILAQWKKAIPKNGSRIKVNALIQQEGPCVLCGDKADLYEWTQFSWMHDHLPIAFYRCKLADKEVVKLALQYWYLHRYRWFYPESLIPEMKTEKVVLIAFQKTKAVLLCVQQDANQMQNSEISREKIKSLFSGDLIDLIVSQGIPGYSELFQQS